MAFDFKREYKEYYLPPREPGIVDVKEANYIAVRGRGDPNAPGGEYQAALELLYGVAYTIKMSRKAGHEIEGWFDYVVPPLEGLWWQEGVCGIELQNKQNFNWISLIRLPDFVTREQFIWAAGEAARKKRADFSKAEFFPYAEGLCVQCMHIGSFDDESETIEAMSDYALKQGYQIDISHKRRHHEIYLSDARRVAPEKRKTVIRHPIRVRAEK